MKKLFSLLTIVFIFMGFGLSVQAEETDYSEYNYYNVSYFNVQDWTEIDNWEADICKSDLSCDFYLHNTCHMAIYCESAYITSDGYDYYNIGFLYKRDTSDDVYAYGYQHLTLISGVTKGTTFCGVETFGNVTGVIDFNYTKICNHFNETGNFKTYYTEDLDTLNFYSYANIHSLDCEDDFGISSNLPIFSSMQDAYDYLMGNLSIKDAENYEDIQGIVYDLEIPQDLKVTKVNASVNAEFNFTWTQTDENYKNWKTEFYVYLDFKYRDSFLLWSWDDWTYIKDYFIQQENIDTYKLKWDFSDEDYFTGDLLDKLAEAYPTDYGGNYEATAFTVYMRNYYNDGEKRHYSNWIKIDMDAVDGKVSSSVIEVEGSEIESDDNGNIVKPDDTVVEDSIYTGEENSNFSEVDGNNILSWINNGFGLLGDNGLLSLMGEAFSFIPSWIWAILGAGVSMFVIVAIFKFVRG